jgi:hypothetical protein
MPPVLQNLMNTAQRLNPLRSTQQCINFNDEWCLTGMQPRTTSPCCSTWDLSGYVRIHLPVLEVLSLICYSSLACCNIKTMNRGSLHMILEQDDSTALVVVNQTIIVLPSIPHSLNLSHSPASTLSVPPLLSSPRRYWYTRNAYEDKSAYKTHIELTPLSRKPQPRSWKYVRRFLVHSNRTWRPIVDLSIPTLATLVVTRSRKSASRI